MADEILERMAGTIQRKEIRLCNNLHDNDNIFNRDNNERPLNLSDNLKSNGRNRTNATRSNPFRLSRDIANGGRNNNALGNGSRTNDEIRRDT